MKTKYDSAKNWHMYFAYEDCMGNDKSIEYTLQYLQDMCCVDFDTALNFIEEIELELRKILKARE